LHQVTLFQQYQIFIRTLNAYADITKRLGGDQLTLPKQNAGEVAIQSSFLSSSFDSSSKLSTFDSRTSLRQITLVAMFRNTTTLK